MREFISELMYMCSPSNTKSRGTYIMIAIILILLPIAAISGIVATIIYAVAGNFQAMPLIITVVALVVEVALIIWLKKS